MSLTGSTYIACTPLLPPSALSLVAVDRGSHVVGVTLLSSIWMPKWFGRQRVVLVGAVVVIAGDDRVADGTDRLGVADRAVPPNALTRGDVEEIVSFDERPAGAWPPTPMRIWVALLGATDSARVSSPS